jgi:hypothetical protein
VQRGWRESLLECSGCMHFVECLVPSTIYTNCQIKNIRPRYKKNTTAATPAKNFTRPGALSAGYGLSRR